MQSGVEVHGVEMIICIGECAGEGRDGLDYIVRLTLFSFVP